MGNYTTVLIAFGLMFSLYYIQATNLFGKIITGVFAALYASYYFKFTGVDPIFIYLIGLIGVLVYAVTQRHLEKNQKLAIGGFSLLIICYNIFSLAGLDVSNYKMIVFFPFNFSYI